MGRKVAVESSLGKPFRDAGERMAEGGPESGERECQKLVSVVAVGESESVSRNQLIKCELLELKNGEMTLNTPERDV
jgi:hypothetical protein